MRKFLFLGAFIFFLIRIISITVLPIFNDEGIYLTWGGRLLEEYDEGKIFISLDGKQIGTPILFGLSQYLPFDPLTNGRLVSVFFSLITYFSILIISKKYLGTKNILPIILLLTFNSYLLLYDRLALPDAIVTAFYSLAFLLVYRLRDRFNIKVSIMLGIIIAAGWYVKSTILLFFIPLCIFYLLSFIKEKILRKRIIVSLGVILLSFYILILPHLEHPLYKNKPHVEYERFLSLKEVSNIPYQIWFTNFSQVVLLIFSYATPLVFLIFIAAIFYARKNKKILLPMLFVLGPIIFEILMLRNIDARYLVVSVPVILLVAGNLLEASTLKRKVLTALTLTGVICSGLLLTFFPLKYHQMIYFIPNARNDFAQYVTSWPSGYGVKEAADWLTQKSQEKNMFVFIRDDSGNPEEAMVVYLRKNEKIIVLPVGLLDELYKNRDHLILSDPGFYFVSRGNQLAGMEKRFREVARYPKPQGQEYVGIYEVIK